MTHQSEWKKSQPIRRRTLKTSLNWITDISQIEIFSMIDPAKYFFWIRLTNATQWWVIDNPNYDSLASSVFKLFPAIWIFHFSFSQNSWEILFHFQTFVQCCLWWNKLISTHFRLTYGLWSMTLRRTSGWISLPEVRSEYLIPNQREPHKAIRLNIY